MVDETGDNGLGTKIPTSLNTKVLKLEPGMHHMENLNLSQDSGDEDIKEADNLAAEKKKQKRLEELKNLGSNSIKNNKDSSNLVMNNGNNGNQGSK